MGYDIVTLETQNHGQDWPLIITAVECPTCGAPVGEMCHAIGTSEGPVATNPMVNTGQQRIDWHAARKQNAAAAWYTRDTSAPPAPEEKFFSLSEYEPGKEPPSPLDGMTLKQMTDSVEDIASEAPKAFEGDKTKTATGKKKGAPPPPPPPPSK